MKKLNILNNVSNKHKLTAACFSLALVASLTTGCIQNSEETGYYVAYNDQNIEVVLTEKQYNEIIETNENPIHIRSYGGNITITKEQLLEATYQKEMPNSLHK